MQKKMKIIYRIILKILPNNISYSMDNCNRKCSDCISEVSAILCDVPSKWRDQIAQVLCQKIDSYGVCCSEVLTCLNNELDTIDYGCLAASDGEWIAYSFIQKIEKIVERVCESILSPDFVATSNTLEITPGGDQGHTPNFEIVLSADDDNALIFGSDGKLFAPIETSPELQTEDSFTIAFTTSGTLNHELTASVIIDPAETNVIVASEDGLYVDGSQFQTPLTFDNGIYNDGGIIKLGVNPLVETTLIDTDGNTFIIGQTESNFTIDNNTHQFLSKNSGAGTTAVFTYLGYNKALEHLSTYTEGITSTFYTKGYRKLDSSESTIGFHIPEGSSPGSLVPVKSAYFKASETNLELYANKITNNSVNNTISSGTLVSGRRYEIITAGGTFYFSGAANNAVGTVFTANTTPPVWSTGSVKLIAEHRNIITGNHGSNTTFQDDFSWYNQIIDTTADLVSVIYNRSDLYVNSIVDYTDYQTNSFYTFGQIAINSADGTMATAYARIGHYVPDSNDAGSPAPSVDVDYTSMSTYSRGAITNYAKKIVNEGVTVIAHQGASAAPHSSAIWEAQSTTKGILFPKMTATQRAAISSPTAGLVVYQTDGTVNERGVWVYDSGSASWKRLNWT